MVVPQLVEAVLVADVLGRVLVGHRVAEPREPPHPRAGHLDERVHQVARRHVLLVVVPRRHLGPAARERRLVLARHLSPASSASDFGSITRFSLRSIVQPSCVAASSPSSSPDAEVDLLAVDVHVARRGRGSCASPVRAGEAAGERGPPTSRRTGSSRAGTSPAPPGSGSSGSRTSRRRQCARMLMGFFGLKLDFVVARLDVRVRPHPALARARRHLPRRFAVVLLRASLSVALVASIRVPSAFTFFTTCTSGSRGFCCLSSGRPMSVGRSASTIASRALSPRRRLLNATRKLPY